MIEPSTYQDLAKHLAKIENRNTKYQFDLEKDIAWPEINKSGNYFADEYLEKGLGVDVTSLKAHPDAWELLQWCEAVTLCSIFMLFEEEVIDFVDREADQVGTSRSLTLLCSEEDKHIALFRNLDKHLRSIKPDHSDRLDEFYKNTKFTLGLQDKEIEFLRQTFGHAGVHVYKWLAIMFFEEATIHIYDAMNVEGANIQPTWLSAHKAHRSEELQHVVTDSHYLEAISLSEEDKRIATALFVCHYLEQFMGLRFLVAAFVEDFYPDVTVMHDKKDLPVITLQYFLSQKALERSKHYAPFLQEMSTMVPKDVWPSLCEALGDKLINGRDPSSPPWHSFALR